MSGITWFWQIVAVFSGVGGVYAFIKDVYGIRTKIARYPKIRNILWYISNKKVCVRISVNKTYHSFEPKTNEVIEVIGQKVKAAFGNYIDPPRVGDNYFQFVAEKMSAPILFKFNPDIDIEKDDTAGVTVQSKVLGNLVFVYREFKNSKEVLKLIEEIYQTIEEIHNLNRPVYSNYSIQATVFGAFEEDWSVKKELKVNDAEIKVGSKIIWANSKTITPLLDLSKYILMLP